MPRHRTARWLALLGIFLPLGAGACGADDRPAASAPAERAAPPAAKLPRLAFVTDAGQARYAIFTAEADGSGLQRITEDIGAMAPVWSPGAAKLLFTKTGLDGSPRGVYEVGADGKGERRAEHLSHDEYANDTEPAWSPDGRSLVATHMEAASPPYEVLDRIDVRTGERSRLAGSRTRDASSATFSPDGKRIAYEGRKTQVTDGGKVLLDDGIFVMDVDGKRARRLTPPGMQAFSPTWIPGQDRIAFQMTGKRNGGFQTHSMAADGGDLRRERVGFNPEWTADGEHVAFIDDHKGTREVFVAKADGSDRRRVTEDLLLQIDVAWATAISP